MGKFAPDGGIRNAAGGEIAGAERPPAAVVVVASGSE
jgi:hypothetical protein